MFYEHAVKAMERDRLAATLLCPHCLEQNRLGLKALIDLDEQGTAFCNACSYSWVPQLMALGR